jgi:hypothetical protein
MLANRMQSPMKGAQEINSPNYSPTNPQSKQSPYLADRAAIAQGGKKQYSPVYSPNAHGITPASPQYSPMGSHRGLVQGSAINSPAYSPSMSAANFSHRSPNYSPAAPVGGAAGISMPVGSQIQQMQNKSPYSPSYSPSSAGFNKSPGYSKHIANSPISPMDRSPYGISPLPISTHSPKMALNLPQQQQYIPPNSSIRAAYNPRSPVYKQEE